MNPIDRLAELFEKFPGIGPRQARRFVQYLLVTNPSVRNETADLIKKLGAEVAQCKKCFRWSTKAEQRAGLCSICGNSSRDAGVLFVVEKEADLEQVERSGFKGLYFVLGGTIPLASEDPGRYIKMKELLKRTEADGTAGTLKEVILGLSATTEGDHTRLILQENLLPLSTQHGFKLSSLGRGLSTGSELEYADPDTIAEALGNRH